MPSFEVIDFFASFSQYQKFCLFIFVVVASFLNHKQWSPKFLALGNQRDLSIPGFGEKFIGVEADGTLELHGEGKLSWTKLQGTIKGLSAISSSFRHKVHVFQIYAGISKYKLTSKDRSRSRLFFWYIFKNTNYFSIYVYCFCFLYQDQMYYLYSYYPFFDKEYFPINSWEFNLMIFIIIFWKVFFDNI